MLSVASEHIMIANTLNKTTLCIPQHNVALHNDALHKGTFNNIMLRFLGLSVILTTIFLKAIIMLSVTSQHIRLAITLSKTILCLPTFSITTLYSLTFCILTLSIILC
jgi:hypothetical protein